LSDQYIRAIIIINGIVQGVGFRPFVYNLALSCHIDGWVNNFPGGVHIEAEGVKESVQTFARRLNQEAPPASSINTFQIEYASPFGYSSFEIRQSSSEHAQEVYISADIAVCKDCLNEMNDPTNKRYRYPFINCTNCGPRFTITSGVPYDRINTTMNEFLMCEKCSREYHDQTNRRFHAQPIACGQCGPRLFLLDSTGKQIAEDRELEKSVELLKRGKILAVKGMGGYHFACDAKNSKAVRELRKRKARDGKPFALMAKDIETVRRYCFVDEQESEMLQGSKRPIVLLKQKLKTELAIESLSPDNNKLGIMLPNAPLHHLLFDGVELLVMTSGNRSGEPIYYKDEEAIEGLRGIADYLLVNNRKIYIRTDDSVTSLFRRKECVIRRSRGYVPVPLDISSAVCSAKHLSTAIPAILACGSELKNTFCLTKGNKAFLSHHIGDLENLETLMSFETGIEHFKKIFSIVPEAVAFDKHPDYFSTQYADTLSGIKKFPIQHHHAHIASCMAENNIAEKVIGIAFDGTGYGDDGKIWGGEFFIGDYSRFERQAHFEYIPLPGGEIGIKEPWRMAVSYLVQAFGSNAFPHFLPFLSKIDSQKVNLVMQQIDKQINTPLTSSVGRLFDAVSSLAGLCNVIEYEGQAAIRLEKEAAAKATCLYPYEIIPEEYGCRIRILQMIRAIAEDVSHGVEISHIAGAFHRTIASITLDVSRLIRKECGLNNVVLSGGVFQNRLLLGMTIDFLERDGFKVYSHSKVPTNDGGISLGQAAIALHKLTEMRCNL
jgi:hydrogenase maturation protein HypF